MSPEIYKQIAFALAVGISTIGPGIGIGIIGGNALNALARNPQLESKIQSTMILGIAFCESLAIFGLVVGFIINFVK
jgi:F-type H+-transporting ATPase subunit c